MLFNFFKIFCHIKGWECSKSARRGVQNKLYRLFGPYQCCAGVTCQDYPRNTANCKPYTMTLFKMNKKWADKHLSENIFSKSSVYLCKIFYKWDRFNILWLIRWYDIFDIFLTASGCVRSKSKNNGHENLHI